MGKIIILILMLVFFNRNINALEQEVKKFRLRGYDSMQRIKWELEANSAKVEAELIKVNPVIIKVYEEDSEIDLQADIGFIKERESLISLQENVVAHANSSNIYLYTDLLNWDANNEKLWTEKRLKIVKDNTVIVGKGGIAKTDLKKVSINKDVRLTTAPATTISCDGPLELDYEKNIAIFNNNVHIVDQRGELFCDKLKVFFDKERKKIIKAHAIGNVKIKRRDSITFAQEAIYNVKEGKITLLGRPKLIIYREER